jgi:hypothetical protein
VDSLALASELEMDVKAEKASSNRIVVKFFKAHVQKEGTMSLRYPKHLWTPLLRN